MRKKKNSKRRHRKSLPQPEVHHTQSRLLIVLEFGWALLFFVLLAVAKEHFVDHSIAGQHIKQTAYDISQVWLATSRDSSHLPIAVVDISTLQPCPQRLADGSVLYPRQALEAAITEVMKQKPAALAIDIDFSPGKDIRCPPLDTEELERDKELPADQLQFSERGGPPFFDFCLDQERPIFLAVYRSQYDAPDQWLGSLDYSGLAATISLPNETHGEEELAKEPGREPDGVRRSSR